MIKKAKKIFWHCAKITKTEKIIELICWLAYEWIHKKKVLWRKVELTEDYCHLNLETIVEIEPMRERMVFIPPFFETSRKKEVQYAAPSIYVAFLHNVMAVGATGMVLTAKSVLFDALMRDRECRIKLPWDYRRSERNGKLWIALNGGVIEVDQAINLCGFGSNNYYHLTVEILSRLEYVNRIPDLADIPILIDETVKSVPQFEELLRMINGRREIIYVPRATRVKAGLLIWPSMNTWMAMNVESWKSFRLSDNLIAKSGIMNIRACVSGYMEEQTERKIFISRRECSNSRLINGAEIDLLFKEAGFDIVFPESLSYVEQIRIFSSSRCVVGVTGAAMTNILYCHQGTIVGCILPWEYHFCIWSTIAGMIGCRTLFLNPEIVSQSKVIAADSYQVDIEQCKRYIQALVQMID